MLNERDHFLQDLGFTKIVNAAGHFTVLGGSRPYPFANEVMEAASRYWIDLNLLEKSAGHFLSSTLGCDDGIVTSGAYSSLVIATSVALSKGEPVTKNKMVIQHSHVSEYAEAFRAGGAYLVEIKRLSATDYIETYVDDKTAGLVYVICEADFPEYSLAETIQAGRNFNIPVIVDASLIDPPISGVRSVLKYGPDMVAVSGGKGFNGPNDTGILIGKRHWIEKARRASFPNYGIGRGMKVSKEQMAGLLATIKIASKKDEERMVQEWMETIEKIRDCLKAPGITIEIEFPWKLNIPQPVPRLRIFPPSGVNPREIREALRNRDPPIITRPPADGRVPETSLLIEPRCLDPEDVDLLADGINSVFAEKI